MAARMSARARKQAEEIEYLEQRILTLEDILRQAQRDYVLLREDRDKLIDRNRFLEEHSRRTDLIAGVLIPLLTLVIIGLSLACWA